MPQDFTLPDLGEGIHEAQVISVSVQEGQEVQQDDVLLEVETDKAAVEIPSPRAGRILKVHARPGQTIKVGDPLVTFADGEQAPSGAPPAEAERAAAASEAAAPTPSTATAVAEPPPAPARAPAAPTVEAPKERPAAPAPTPVGEFVHPPDRPVPASPAIRRLARERGIDLRRVPGTGPGGRITREDFERYVAGLGAAPEAAAAPAMAAPGAEPLPDFSRWGPVRREPLTQIRKTIANAMTRSYTTAVHVTHGDVCDVTQLEALRRDHNAARGEDEPKLTLLPFVIKAVVQALREYPKFNSSFDHQRGEIIYKDYYHIGIAVDTPRGLVVPVLRDADRKSIPQIAAELKDMADKTREAKFAIEDLRGGTFTITNIGALGGMFFTPIINYPEVAILGLGRAAPQAVVCNGSIEARTMMPVCLTFDHRVCDGAEAARFTNRVIELLEHPMKLLLTAG